MLLVATLALVAMLVVAAFYVLSSLRPSAVPVPVAELDGSTARSGLGNCFWFAVINPETNNIDFPDTGVTYWLTQFRLPEGARLAFRGQFPHARYMSINTYNTEGMPLDRINDSLIVADDGSTNPYVDGARRDGEQRNYRLRLLPRTLSAGDPIDDGTRPRNTFYTTAQANALHQAIYRVYVPDQGHDARGGVGLPEAELEFADGRKVAGEALCKDYVVKEDSLRDIKITPDAYRRLLGVPGARSPVHPAQNPPRWWAFFNPKLVVATALYGTPLEGLIDHADATRRGGFYSTLDNTYMASWIDRRAGPVLVLRARAPTTPATLRGAATMQAGQLRYWSVCKYRSLSVTAVDSCIFDEQVPRDTDGNFTIAISAPADRPANARSECGVAWMDWGVAGDGLGNPYGGILVFRHMMAAPDFLQRVYSAKAARRRRGHARRVLSSLCVHGPSGFRAARLPARSTD